MRNNLAKLEGQRLQFEAVFFDRHATIRNQYMLVQVRLEGNQVAGHVNVKHNGKLLDKIRNGQKLSFTATVGKYTRGDGSVDYDLQTIRDVKVKVKKKKR